MERFMLIWSLYVARQQPKTTRKWLESKIRRGIEGVRHPDQPIGKSERRSQVQQADLYTIAASDAQPADARYTPDKPRAFVQEKYYVYHKQEVDGIDNYCIAS